VAAQFVVGLAHFEGYCVEKDGLAAYYWLRVAEENSGEFRHRSRALVEQLRTTVKTEELEAVEENVAKAVKNNKLLKSQPPVEFIKRKPESPTLRLAI
jgi:TPR repeat protein